MELDISSINEIGIILDIIKKQYGNIDGLINCAGIGLFGRLEELPDIEIKECVDVNLLGTMICIKHVSGIMKAQGFGHIITVESLAADNGVRYGEVYSATKAGISMFTATIEKELRKNNVKVTSIKPGLVNTKLIDRIKQNNDDTLYGLEPEDVADAIIFAFSQNSISNVSEIKLRPFDLRGQSMFQEMLDEKYNYMIPDKKEKGDMGK